MEEFKIQQEQRQAALEYANKKIHDNDDQVKAFHSKMLLADTL